MKSSEWYNDQKQASKTTTENPDTTTLVEIPAYLSKVWSDRTSTTLEFRACNLSNNDFEVLCSLLALRKQDDDYKPILMMDFRNAGITVESLTGFAKALKECPECCVLDLSENNLGDQGIKKIFEIVADSQIKAISLSRVGAKNIDVRFIGDLILRNRSLNRIDFSSNDFIEEQFQDLLALLKDEQLEIIGSLNINNHQIVNSKNQKTKKRRNDFEESRVAKQSKNNFDQKNISTVNNDASDHIEYSLLKCRSLLTSERRKKIIDLENYTTSSEDLHRKKADGRYRDDCRQFQNRPQKIRLDNRFFSFNINEILDGYFICEGPDPKNPEALANFFGSLLYSEDLSQTDTLLVIGLPTDDEEYSDYFTKTRRAIEMQGYTVTSIPEHQEPNIYVYNLTIEKDNKQKKMKLINVRGRLGSSGLVLDDLDKMYLYDLALNLNPQSVISHCDLGIGFSAVILFSFYLFREFHNIFIGSTLEIMQKILMHLESMRRINPNMIPKKEMMSKAISLAFDYIDFHCQNIVDNKVKKRIHGFCDIKTIGLLGKIEGEDESFNYITEQLQDRGVHVSVINLLYKSEGKEFCDNQVLNVKNYFRGDEKILTNLVAATARRVLREKISNHEIQALLICDADVPGGVIASILEENLDLPKICMIAGDVDINNRNLNKDSIIIYNNEGLEEANPTGSYTKTTCDNAIATVYGVLVEKRNSKQALPSKNNDKHILFWAPLKSYGMQFADNCEDYLTQLGYSFDKFVMDDEDGSKKVTNFVDSQNVNFIIELPYVSVNNTLTGECQYVNVPLTCHKTMHYIFIVAGIDFIESNEEFLKRNSSHQNNRFITMTSSHERIAIMKKLSEKINHLVSHGNSVDIFLPMDGLSQYDQKTWEADVQLETIKKTLDNSLTQPVAIHEINSHINDYSFVKSMMEIIQPYKNSNTINWQFFGDENSQDATNEEPVHQHPRNYGPK